MRVRPEKPRIIGLFRTGQPPFDLFSGVKAAIIRKNMEQIIL
jgi:hypothetical protein